MKFLILSHKPPYPILDGGCLAMSRLLQDILTLNNTTQVSYHTLATHKHPFNKDHFLQHPKLNVKAHFIDTRLGMFAALIALIKQESYNLTRFKDNKIIGELKKELSVATYDFVIFESLYAAIYAAPLSAFSQAKFIYRAHNIEYQIWKDLAKNSKNLFKKWYLNQLAYSLKWAERSIWSEDQGELDLILSISESNLELIESQTLTACKYLPSSIESSKFQSTLSPMKLCFLGAFNWNPNIEAVEWFLSEIFVVLLKAFPKLEFHIAGKDSQNFKHWLRPGVHIHGFVPDPKEFIANHGIFVGCLQSGSGVKMKILEAMSVGAPIVLSSKSADGLSNLDKSCIQPDLNAFINELNMLLTNQEKLRERSAYFKQYFEKHFGTEHVQKQLYLLLDELQNNG